LPCLLADRFDYPVGFPDAYGYYTARGYTPNGHLGEDWNGRGGGNSDEGDSVYAIANGVVVFSANHHMGWGNVIILRHAFKDKSTGKVRFVDSLYGHLGRRYAELNEVVPRGKKIGTIGTNNGMYWAHLHFEIRRNISIGMERSQFATDYSNYYSPSRFIEANRVLMDRPDYKPVSVPVNTFRNTQVVFAGNRLPPPAPRMSVSASASASSNGDTRYSPDQAVDDAVMKMLRKDGHSAPQSYAKTAPKPTERPVPNAEDQAEREKIRSFWGKVRNRMTTPEMGSLEDSGAE